MIDTVTDITTMNQSTKQRLTAFVDPLLVTRAKVRGALEGLTISEVVERALDAYAPIIHKTVDEEVNLKFNRPPALDGVIHDEPIQTLPVTKNAKLLAAHK